METQADLMIDEADLATDPPLRDDWWISSFDDLSLCLDTDIKNRNDSHSTHGNLVSKKLRAIRKDSVRASLRGEVKTLLQQWECIVLKTDDKTVHCEMHDLTDETKPIEYAELFWSEFNDYDKPFLDEGAVFYWSIGYLKKTTGQVRKFSETRLRRTPKLAESTKREISRKVKLLNDICSGKSRRS